ncbi:MAG: hypothetical protein KAX20_06830 [Candidatus Omnitrophica bacterium]|nr:hypothetical protein [Candidatus Omnitrophota bacterium]
MKLKKLSFVIFLILLSSCGYRIVRYLPPDISSIAIPILKNDTYHPGIEVPITNRIIIEFLQDGSLKVRKERESDLLLLGRITKYGRDVIAYDSEDTDEPIAFSLYIRLRFILKDLRNNKVLWDTSELSGTTSYYVTGIYSKTEEEALTDATEDLARKVVEKVVEYW